MNAKVDCPEDLLVHRRRQSLTSAEARTLADHTRACDLCRMSLSLGSAVAPLPPIDDADAALAARWVAGALAPGPSPSGRTHARSRRQHRVIGQRRWLATAAALLLTAGVAAAAAWQRMSSSPPAAPAVDPARESAAWTRGANGDRRAWPRPRRRCPQQRSSLRPRSRSRRRRSRPRRRRHRWRIRCRGRRIRSPPSSASHARCAAIQLRRRRRACSPRRTARGASGGSRTRRSSTRICAGRSPRRKRRRSRCCRSLTCCSRRARPTRRWRDSTPIWPAPPRCSRKRRWSGEPAPWHRIEGRGADERAAWRQLLDRYPRSTYGWRARQRLARSRRRRSMMPRRRADADCRRARDRRVGAGGARACGPGRRGVRRARAGGAGERAGRVRQSGRTPSGSGRPAGRDRDWTCRAAARRRGLPGQRHGRRARDGVGDPGRNHCLGARRRRRSRALRVP